METQQQSEDYLGFLDGMTDELLPEKRELGSLI